MGATTTRDGERVAVGTAAAFDRLAAAFKKRFGLTLHVRSGLRTWQEQYDLWVKYKYHGGTYALHPDDPQANHVEGNPSGGRSLDVYDSGADAGVTVAGTVRANWLKANAAKRGFWARGYNFNEPWHIEYQGNPWAAPASTGTSIKEDELSEKAERQINSIFDAIFEGGSDMPDNRKSIGQSLADIASLTTKPVTRDGKEVPVRQDNADTGTLVREILTILSPITRDGEKVAMRQDLADTGTIVREVLARQRGQEEALKALAAAKGFDPDAVMRAAEQGVINGLKNVSFTAQVD